MLRFDVVEAVNQAWSAMSGEAAATVAEKLKDRNQRRRIVEEARRGLEAEPGWAVAPSEVRRLLGEEWFLELLAFPKDAEAVSRAAVPSEAELDRLFGPEVEDATRYRWLSSLAGAVWSVAAQDASIADAVQAAMLRRIDETLLHVLSIGLATHDDVAALKATAAVTEPPAELPAAPSGFVGRDEDVARLSTSCRRAAEGQGPRVVIVSGPPAVGKSALSLHVAHAVKAGFPDGQLYRNLRAAPAGPRVDPASVLAQFLRSLGVPPGDVPDDVEGRAAAYRSVLASRRVLVVLDDVADEGAVRDLVPGDGPSVVVITSRRPLLGLDGVASHELSVLDADAATELVAMVGGRARHGADEEGLAEIAELCGYLPLALRIAAARLRARPDRATGDLARRLQDQRRILGQLRLGDLDVRASFDLSYEALDPEAARLFARLSLAPGWAFSRRFAAALADDGADVDDLLDALVIDHLVEPVGRPNTFTMHPLLRSFAAEKIPPEGDWPLAERILAWYLDHIGDAHLHLYSRSPGGDGSESQPDEVREAREWLEDEAPNLGQIVALVAHLTSSEDEAATRRRDRVVPDGDAMSWDLLTARLAVAVAGLYTHLGFDTERGDALAVGLTAAVRANDVEAHCMVLNELGCHAARTGDHTGAVDHWTRALELMDAATHTGPAGALHERLAIAYRRLGRTDDADREAARALVLMEAADPSHARLFAADFPLDALIDAATRGRPFDATAFDAAVAAVEAALPAATAVIGVLRQLETRLDLAVASAIRGRDNHAIRHLEICRKLAAEFGATAYQPRALLLLGEAYERERHRARAREAWQEGLDIADGAGAIDRVGGLTYNLARSDARDGDLAGAAGLLTRSAEAFAEVGQPFNQTGALQGLAYMRHCLRDRTGAEAAWDEALTVLTTLATTNDPARARRSRSAIEADRTAGDTALRDRAHRWARQAPTAKNR